MRWFYLAVIVSLLSCSDKGDAPDVSGIKADITIQRFDRDFFSLDTTQLQTSLTQLQKKYPSFLQTYFEYFAPVRDMAEQQGISFETALVQYFRFMKPLQQAVAQKFPEVSGVEKDLEAHFRYVKYYFPRFKIPAVLTSVESLNPENPTEIYGTTYYHDSLFISLQMFLGKDYPAYDPTQYPDYLRRRFEPAFIVPNSMRAIAGGLYSDSAHGASLIEKMIEKGKQWWLMKKFMPDTEDSLITGYTAQQTKDLKREEGNIWGHINQTEDLFSTYPVTVQTYIGEAPFTQTLPQAAPGNIGPWIGWRIIQKFEEKNSKLSVEQVLRTTALKIFEEAKYKPK
jgi:hypothetical protein